MDMTNKKTRPSTLWQGDSNRFPAFEVVRRSEDHRRTRRREGEAARRGDKFD
jgi:hypothetical protein